MTAPFQSAQSIRSLVFFGTPEFAVPSLRALVDAGRRPVLVVTQPPRPAGRGQAPREPPVAVVARELDIPVEQPERVRRPEFLERMKALSPDLAVVVAFGQIFPQALLDIPRHGCVNVHASLLPRHRGAAPIQAAILAGDRETGVTTMRMSAGMDEGPMLLSAATPIGERESAGELSVRLAELGGQTLVRTLATLEEGKLVATPQDSRLATYAAKLDKAAARVDWTKSAATLERRFRAQTPWPGLETGLGGETVKLFDLSLAEPRTPSTGPTEPAREVAGTGAPGTLLGLEAGELLVACGDRTTVRVGRLQRAGRRAVAAGDFWRGERLEPGSAFEP